MIKKLLIIAIVAILFINCQEFLDKENQTSKDDYYLEVQKMMVENVRSSLELFQKYSDALDKFKENMPHALRNLQQYGDCTDCISPRKLDCPCSKNSQCCSKSCLNNKCAVA